MKTLLRLLFAAAFAGAAAVSTHAASIGVNFGSPALGFAGEIGPMASAGVVPQTNWMDVTNSAMTNLTLTDSTGAATTAQLTYADGMGFPTLQIASLVAGGDELLNNSYLWLGGAAPQLTINGVPYATYNVILYISSVLPGRTHEVTVDGTTYYGLTPNSLDAGYVDGNSGTPYTYTQAVGTNSGSATTNANYYLFTDLTAGSFTISLATPNDVLQVSAFQIVDAVPEPTTATLLMGGMCALAAWRWRRRK
ncbi:MAG: PEP-CTERM sorting domain-containing protein [Chthoniobacterales bacterium]|nr:PEP-CTERM sorting domain-containing protein [Chthoniobacterales bacterium]